MTLQEQRKRNARVMALIIFIIIMVLIIIAGLFIAFVDFTPTAPPSGVTIEQVIPK